MKVSSRILGGVIILAAFYGSYSIVSSIVSRDPPIYYEGARALSQTVNSGGTIDVEFKVFRKRICDQLVHRYLTDAKGTRHSIAAYTFGLKFLAGRETYERSISIPDAAAVGAAPYVV